MPQLVRRVVRDLRELARPRHRVTYLRRREREHPPVGVAVLERHELVDLVEQLARYRQPPLPSRSSLRACLADTETPTGEVDVAVGQLGELADTEAAGFH